MLLRRNNEDDDIADKDKISIPLFATVGIFTTSQILKFFLFSKNISLLFHENLLVESSIRTF